MEAFVALLLNVVYAVTLLATIALGLAVIFGLLGVLNIAHGEFVMVGAFCALVVDRAGLPFLLAVPLALAVGAVLGAVVEIALIRPLYRRPFDTLVATWGLSLLLREIAEAVFGPGFNSVSMPLRGTVEVFGAAYPTYRLLLILVCLAVLAGLLTWYARSSTGLRIRAMVGNPDLARAQGLRVTRLATGAFIVGTCLAALAGVMLAPLIPVYPFMGLDYVLRAFFVLVVGGLGSIAGLASGAAVIGGLDSVISTLADNTFAYSTVLLVAILFLWLKPRGLFPSG